jgi:hypothetical protein
MDRAEATQIGIKPTRTIILLVGRCDCAVVEAVVPSGVAEGPLIDAHEAGDRGPVRSATLSGPQLAIRPLDLCGRADEVRAARAARAALAAWRGACGLALGLTPFLISKVVELSEFGPAWQAEPIDATGRWFGRRFGAIERGERSGADGAHVLVWLTPWPGRSGDQFDKIGVARLLPLERASNPAPRIWTIDHGPILAAGRDRRRGTCCLSKEERR